jgi:hypothetical protein
MRSKVDLFLGEVDIQDHKTFVKAGAILAPRAASNIQEKLRDIFEPVGDNNLALSTLSNFRTIISNIRTSPGECVKIMISPLAEIEQLPE